VEGGPSGKGWQITRKNFHDEIRKGEKYASFLAASKPIPYGG